VRLLNDALDELEEAGLLRQVHTEPIRYQPARSIDKITIGDVMRAVREHGRDPSALRDDETMKALLERLYQREDGIFTMTIEEAIRKFQLDRADHPADSDEAPETA